MEVMVMMISIGVNVISMEKKRKKMDQTSRHIQKKYGNEQRNKFTNWK
jgi:proteasome assembly chaperone (PAC2) family protein